MIIVSSYRLRCLFIDFKSKEILEFEMILQCVFDCMKSYILLVVVVIILGCCSAII